jgi:hypothetical protein
LKLNHFSIYIQFLRDKKKKMSWGSVGSYFL